MQAFLRSLPFSSLSFLAKLCRLPVLKIATISHLAPAKKSPFHHPLTTYSSQQSVPAPTPKTEPTRSDCFRITAYLHFHGATAVPHFSTAALHRTPAAVGATPNYWNSVSPLDTHVDPACRLGRAALLSSSPPRSTPHACSTRYYLSLPTTLPACRLASLTSPAAKVFLPPRHVQLVASRGDHLTASGWGREKHWGVIGLAGSVCFVD